MISNVIRESNQKFQYNLTNLKPLLSNATSNEVSNNEPRTITKPINAKLQ